ncbi:hypothetical protein [Sulfuricystis thermophila]|uniref:hypothetical protein n=1 Tax=Sulfuricystis thermophila TaxID=2496847 RepID=UPI00103571E4|nr:hypothetical protein [Sulfuricystis thermophila]
MKLSDLPADLLAARPHLFSPASVAVTAADHARMREVILAVEEVVALKLGADGTAPSASGVFMGYDFHLTPEGPRLIEINTNAGGGLLAALQAERDDVLAAYVEMFRSECGKRELRMVAIVDETPEQQYLYPELVGFRQLFEAHGIRAAICAPEALMICHGGLWYSDGVTETRIDLVYNRLTDFTLDLPESVALRLAWLHEDTVVTPNPQIHALYADKKNLVALTDPAQLAEWGVQEQTRRILMNGIPRTEAVTVACAEDLWNRRRGLFFKPAMGFGSKGAYRGDKLTKRVFAEILAGDYVAQAYVPPSTVPVEVDGQMSELKADIRNYVYRGTVQLVTARLYQGQTTNFRTPGGGFAKVIER